MPEPRVIVRRAAIAAGALLCAAGHAQDFVADYTLVARALPVATPAFVPLGGIIKLGPVRIGPALLDDTRRAGAGLVLRAGANWFGEIGMGHAPAGAVLLQPGVSELVHLAGGYRWSDGQVLSLQFSREKGTVPRLGLAMRYEWPRYFVRVSREGSLQDSVRFAAGLRF